MRLIIKLAINAAALYAATRFVDGIHFTGAPAALIGVALVFAVINSTIKPVVKFFSFPIVFLTLGLFSLVINAAMLLATSRLSATLGLGFFVRGFGAAFWGGLVVSVVSIALEMLVPDGKKH